MNESDFKLFRDLLVGLEEVERDHPVAQYCSAGEMSRLIDLDVNHAPMSDQDWADAMGQLLRWTPKTTTRHFFNQLFGGRQSKAVIGDMLAVWLNNSMYTYKVGGPMILMEKAIINALIKRLGMPDTSAGTMASGGSMTNFMGMLMARDSSAPDIRSIGAGSQLTAYTSEEAHYSVLKNAAFAGIGRDRVRLIPADEWGAMDAVALRAAIRKDRKAGMQPFFVNATAGTTVLGAFDPLEQIAGIAREEKVWMHVDAALGGAVMFSKQYQYLLAGCASADSVSFNAHKLLGVPLSCSFILTRHPQCLYDSFANDANYLYQTDSDEINPGKISLQCARRNNALKFWALWKSIGSEGLEQIVDQHYNLASYARDYIRSHKDYTLCHDTPSINVCFNYKHIPAPHLCNSLYEASELMVGYGSFRGNEFVRMSIVNPNNEEQDILDFFHRLERHAERL